MRTRIRDQESFWPWIRNPGLGTETMANLDPWDQLIADTTRTAFGSGSYLDIFVGLWKSQTSTGSISSNIIKHWNFVESLINIKDPDPEGLLIMGPPDPEQHRYIPDPDLGFLPIPDPASRGQKGTESRIRNTGLRSSFFNMKFIHCNFIKSSIILGRDSAVPDLREAGVLVRQRVRILQPGHRPYQAHAGQGCLKGI